MIQIMMKPITQADIDEASELFKLHGEPFNKDGWQIILDEFGGYLPLSIEAVPEGTILPLSNVLAQVVNTDIRFYWLTTWIETSLLRTICWYATTVATNSRTIKKLMKVYYDKSGSVQGLDFKLHDFGSRGVSSKESAGIGGLAHLINFMGTDTVEAVMYGRKYYDIKMAGFSIPACYDDKTETLTDSGWKLFSELNQTDKVAQYNDDESIEFVNFTNYVNEYYEGDMIKFKSSSKVGKFDLLVTPNHRMIRKSIKTDKIEIYKADEIKFSHRNKILNAGYVNGECEFTDVDKFKIAFQADGSYFTHNDYDGSISGCKAIRFSFKKERKIERLEIILNSCDFDYTMSINKETGYTHFYVKIPLTVEFDKDFDWVDISNIDSNWGKQFIDELQYWDGCLKFDTIVYSTINKKCSDIISSICALSGFRCNINYNSKQKGNRQPLYTISISNRNYRTGINIDKSTIHYSGKIYCVSVSSGMLLVRRNNVVSISGNSEHSTITTWGILNESKAYKNMLEQYKDYPMIACVSDSYNIYKAVSEMWGKTFKHEILDGNQVVVVRPDTGDPLTVPIKIIEMLMDKFGYTMNSQGYRTLPNQIRVIQGDGITKDSIKDILVNMEKAKLSLDNLAFGMGGGLLQHTNRDVLKFAMKASAIMIDGEWNDVWKDPIEGGKRSKRGVLGLYHNENTGWQTERKLPDDGSFNGMKLVYDNGRNLSNAKFDEIRNRARID